MPDRTNPESVVISGVTYKVGSSEAAYALSVLGGHSLGESLTVLLGRDDSVVAVLGAGSGNATVATTSELIGVVSAVGTKNYSDSSANDYRTDYVQVLATDGQSYEFSTNKGYNVGALVRVRTNNGTSTVSGLGTSARGNLSGTVDAEANRIGNRQLAANVEILDVYQTKANPIKVAAVKLHRSRLAGMRLETADVLYWEQDEDGYISKLVLNNVSGDLFTYGILQKAEEEGSSASYEGVINGQVQAIPSSNVSYNVNRGGVAILKIGESIVSMSNLSSVNLQSIDGANSVTDSAGNKWLLSDSVQVYESRDGSYYQTSLNLLNTSNYTLRAYYDKSMTKGGRIRIIVATVK